MNDTDTGQRRILAVFPSTRGFGFAVFEGLSLPIDWGVKLIATDKNTQSLAKIEGLVGTYKPTTIVVEDYSGEASRKCERIQHLIRDIIELARTKNISTRSYSRAQIRECFSQSGAFTKYEIAQAIATRLPELEPRIPPVREIWMPEDYRMSIFDALALAITFFHFVTEQKKVA